MKDSILMLKKESVKHVPLGIIVLEVSLPQVQALMIPRQPNTLQIMKILIRLMVQLKKSVLNIQQVPLEVP